MMLTTHFEKELSITMMFALLLATFLVLFCITHAYVSSSNRWTRFNGNSCRMNQSKRCSLKMSSAETGKPSTLKVKLAADMKDAMKNKQKNRLTAIRSIQTAIKQKEVDERIEVDDDAAIAIMSKIVKQRRESIKSYSDAGRQDLADNEQEELDVINAYLPQPFSAEEVDAMINEAITRLAATTIKDMGKVMNDLRPKMAGKADIAQVGDLIKKKLGGAK
jgi:uncharacterized protein